MDNKGLQIDGVRLLKYYGEEETVLVPDTVKVIDEFAFSNNTTIKNVFLPQGIIIKESAFFGCNHLERLTENGVALHIERLGESVFWGCENLVTNIIFTGHIIRKDTFYNCKHLKKVELLDETDIEEDAFYGCENLSRICLEDQKWIGGNIEKGAFCGCEQLCSEISLFQPIIEEETFYNCQSLLGIYLPQGIELEESVFWNCKNLKYICDRESILSIGRLSEAVFFGCESLSTPIKVTGDKLPEEVFYNCKKLQKIYLPQHIDIDDDAFDGCNAKKIHYDRSQVSLNSKLPINNQNKNQTSLKNDFVANSIGFKDFVVRTTIYQCSNKGHNIQELTAVIFCLTKKGDIVEKKVMAGYCQTCNLYYLLNTDYERLRKQYVLLCRVIDNTIKVNNGTGLFSNFNRESIMMQYGYTVSQAEELSDAQRRTILEFLLISKVMTKTEICSHLDWLISTRGYDKSRFKKAITKWREDRQFIENYKLNNSREVIVKRIIKH